MNFLQTIDKSDIRITIWEVYRCYKEVASNSFVLHQRSALRRHCRIVSWDSNNIYGEHSGFFPLLFLNRFTSKIVYIIYLIFLCKKFALSSIYYIIYFINLATECYISLSSIYLLFQITLQYIWNLYRMSERGILKYCWQWSEEDSFLLFIKSLSRCMYIYIVLLRRKSKNNCS